MLSIDITDTHVRLVKGRTSGKKIIIQKADTRNLIENSINNGLIKDLHMIAGEITDLLVSNKIREKNTIVCINSGTILYKEMLLPRTRATGKAAEWIIESMIRNDMSLSEDYNISYTIVGEENEDGVQMYKLVATACPQKIIDGYKTLFQQVGLNLKQIAISNNCISRLIRNSPIYRESMPLLLLQADTKFVNINLYRDGKISLSRYMRADPADYENNPDYVNLVVFDNLFRIIHFLGQQPDAEPIKEIQYYGVIHDKTSLQNSISQFNIPAHELLVPKRVEKKCEFDFLLYAGAIGAFNKINKKTENINLLDSTKARTSRSNRNYFIAVFASAFVCLCVILGFTVYTGLINSYTHDVLNAATLEYEHLNYEEISRRVNEKKADISTFEAYCEKVELAKALFDFQPKMIPDILVKLQEVLLSGMSVAGNVTVNDYSVSATFYCPLPEQPSLFVEALTAQDFFENISYSGYTAVTRDGEALDVFTFTLTMRIKGGHQFEAE